VNRVTFAELTDADGSAFIIHAGQLTALTNGDDRGGEVFGFQRGKEGGVLVALREDDGGGEFDGGRQRCARCSSRA
jgi:hypothetical protein